MARSSKMNPPLLAWGEREKDLANLRRYRRFPVMFYRTNLAVHSQRVEALVGALLPKALEYYPNLDGTKTTLISRFHDDFEMVSRRGDLPLQMKLAMDKSELSILKQEELAACDFLVRQYGDKDIQGYSYRDLLMHSILKDCQEAELHSFVDKLDGYCEALHEVLAGNVVFIEPLVNYSVRSFFDLSRKFPSVAKMFDGGPLELAFPAISLGRYQHFGVPHTPESVKFPCGVNQYELWKRVTLSLERGMEWLTKQTEHY